MYKYLYDTLHSCSMICSKSVGLFHCDIDDRTLRASGKLRITYMTRSNPDYIYNFVVQNLS